MILPLIFALALQRQAQSAYDRQQLDQQAQERTKESAKPIFLKTPGLEDIQKVYPADALAKKVAGEATVHCTIDKTGSFSKCSVQSETPAKAGFGPAALELAKVFKLDTKASDGSSVVGVGLTIPMKFTPP